MLRKLGFGLTAAAIMTPGIAAALGVGEYELNSYLNQPLDMEVSLHEVGDLTAEEILVSLASQTEYDAAGVERNYFLNRLAFSVELLGADKAVLHITSDQPVREPYLNFLVEFLWPTGRLMREYTVLLDPPSYSDSSLTAAPTITRAPAPIPSVSSEPAPAPASEPSSGWTPAPATTESEQPASTGIKTYDSGERDTYTVRASDTMWQIALDNRPANSVSVQQMLVAIQDMNPDAFINSNVNLVREGTVLRIPNEQEVREVSTRNALTKVAEQNRQWQDMLEARGIEVPQQRAQLDGSRQVVDRADEEQGPESGQVTLVAPESTAGVDDGDSTGSAEQGSANTAVLENELAIRDENLDRLDRENAELKSRLEDLQGQVDTSEQMLQLRSDQIAQLQEELRKLREQQGVESASDDPLLAEVEMPESAAETEAETEAAADQAQPETAGQDAAADAETAEMTTAGDEVAGSEEPAGDSVAQDAEETAAKPAAPAVSKAPEVAKPKPAAPAQPAQPESKSIVDLLMENILYVGLGLIALLLLVVALLRRNKKEEPEEEIDGPLFAELDDEDDQDAFGLNLEDDDGLDVPVVESGAQDAAGSDVDPLEKVEMYAAYGQFPQAMEFLRNEINHRPERADLKIRLLELYKEMDDEAGFQQQATAYAGINFEVDAAIARLGGEAAATDDDELSLDDLEMGLSSELDEPAAPTIEADSDSDELGDFDFSLDNEDTAESGDTLELDQPAAEHDQELDDAFTLDLDGDDEPAAAQDKPLSAEDEKSLSAASLLSLDDVGSASLDDESTDFGDLNLDDISAEFSDTDEPSADDTLDLSLDDLDLDGDDAESAKEDDTLADLDFDLSLDEEESAAPVEKAAVSSGSESATDDLDLDLELDDVAMEAEEETSLDDLLNDDDLDLDVSDEDLAELDALDAAEEPSAVAEPEPAPAVEAEPVAEAAPVSEVATVADDVLSDEDDDFDFLGETDENATKLDLAKAYIDMGDAEGAKDILNEVLSEGNDQQQAEARELMAQVG